MHKHYSPLLTDLYQLTMAYGYWQLNMHNQQAVFHLLFRKNPFRSNYAVNCGLASVRDFLADWHFHDDDLDYLSTLNTSNGNPLFEPAFLDYLKTLAFTCTIEAIPEGTVVFAHEPLLRITGPLLQCQLLESPLLNIVNFQTLIATKASRVCRAAAGDPVIEFGMRRAQGPDGAISASRAAYIGGCIATSNTLAGKLYDIPLRGTHAHSWVSVFADEQHAFDAYIQVMPHNAILLVDTYDTLTGVNHAIEAGKKLREINAELLGIRLDSGDMTQLSIAARKQLDDAGFHNTAILASNSLDEYVIRDLKSRGAAISAWGVGTNLTTAYDQPALDGVYKISALQNKQGEWEYKIKLSEQTVKVSNPGRHQIRRYFYNNRYVMDVIYDEQLGISDIPEVVVLDDTAAVKKLDDVDAYVDLLTTVCDRGRFLSLPSIHDIRSQSIAAVHEFDQMHAEKVYPVALEKNLFELKRKLIAEKR